MFLHNTTARWKRRILWAKRNTMPYIHISNIDGRTPRFHMDSREPDWSKLSAEPTAYHRDRYLLGEVCYNSLTKTFPQEAEVAKAANTRKNRENGNEQLFVATERNAKIRYEGYKKLAEL